ncbi:hypothetical protein SAMN05444266_103482 [Chitinophaga jiangningensis]|uniref:Uncharacterized protein n=1 Tax=Chitinophaga jiangningensis TaxID=1419482 RepID=A0A1M7B0P6_9BACT|nr:hypothetical protein SAMN05444266_103482 [Chitinophaga jiangningensis]
MFESGSVNSGAASFYTREGSKQSRFPAGFNKYKGELLYVQYD